MRKEIIFKVILVLIIGIVLFAKPINVFATDLTELFSEYEDQGSKEDLQEDEITEEQDTTQTEITTTTTPTTQEQIETELPTAGLAEDTVMVVTVIALVAVAIIALKKVNEYSNI